MLSVVGDHRSGSTQFLVDPLQRFQHHDAGFGIQRAGRLVAQQHVRVLGDGTGNRHALLFATGELRRKMIEALTQSHQGQARLAAAWACEQISVTTATFSSAVRLGIRL